MIKGWFGQKCIRRDGSIADKKYIMGGWKSLVLRDFRDPGSSRAGVAEIPFSVRGNLSRILFSEDCGTTFAFRQVVDTILLFDRSRT